MEVIELSNVHYFARYSQKENMATNNTLLLFSRLYNNSNDKFNRFLKGLIQDDNFQLDVRLNFAQQVKGDGSIPDGMITQESIKIIIETKLYGQKNIGQIEKHLKSFKNEDKQIFFFIDKDDITRDYRKSILNQIEKYNTKNNTKISLIATTFKDVCDTFEDILDDYDFEMIGLIEDYRAFCTESNLINNFETKIRTVLCGTTLEQNLRTNVYYAPADRGYQDSKYLGLYKNKAIRALGIVRDIIDIDLINNKLVIQKVVKGHYKSEYEEVLLEIIEEAKEEFQYDLRVGSRFFFVDEYIKTSYEKPTKGGLMGTKYFDLNDIDGFEQRMTIYQIAELLNGKEWD